jgi:hypothetical protein
MRTIVSDNMCMIADDTLPAFVKAIVPFESELWHHANEETNRTDYRVSGSLFDEIPKVNIEQEDLPDPNDMFDDLDLQAKYNVDPENGHTVYFAISPASGLVKIGFSSSIYFRKANYNCTNGAEIDFVETFGSRQFEKALHQRFRAIRKHRSWFYPHPALMAYICRNM